MIDKICEIRKELDSKYNEAFGLIEKLSMLHWEENHHNFGCENDIKTCREDHESDFIRILDRIVDEVMTLWRANSYLMIVH